MSPLSANKCCVKRTLLQGCGTGIRAYCFSSVNGLGLAGAISSLVQLVQAICAPRDMVIERIR